MDAHWLVDENVDIRVAAILRTLDRSAVHVTENLGASANDFLILETAAREFDILLTRDLFRQQEEWEAARQAMLSSLRIVRIRFRSRITHDPVAQARALLWRLREVESTLAERPQVRLVTLSGDEFVPRYSTVSDLQAMRGPIGGAA